VFQRIYVCFDACKRGFLADVGELLEWMDVFSRGLVMES